MRTSLSSGVLTAMILGEEDGARVGAGAGADADTVADAVAVKEANVEMILTMSDSVTIPVKVLGLLINWENFISHSIGENLERKSLGHDTPTRDSLLMKKESTHSAQMILSPFEVFGEDIIDNNPLAQESSVLFSSMKGGQNNLPKKAIASPLLGMLTGWRRSKNTVVSSSLVGFGIRSPGLMKEDKGETILFPLTFNGGSIVSNNIDVSPRKNSSHSQVNSIYMQSASRLFFPVAFSSEEGHELARSSVSSSMNPLSMTIHTRLETVPPRSPDKLFTVVWDIDRTLINIDQISKGTGTSFVYRPYALQSLGTLSTEYPQIEFIIWTAGDVNHAAHVITDILHKNPDVRFDHIIARAPGEGTEYEQHSRKPLHLLKRDLGSVIIVDDSVKICQSNAVNCIAVCAYEGSRSLREPDCDLFYVTQIIGLCSSISSMRSVPFSEAMSGLPFLGWAMLGDVKYRCINWNIKDKDSLQSAVDRSLKKLPYVHAMSHQRR